MTSVAIMMKKIFKEEQSIEILKIIGYFIRMSNIYFNKWIYNYFKEKTVQGNINHKFILKNIYKTRSYFIDGINQNDLMGKKQREVCTALNYIDHLLILASAVTGCISIFAFASLVGFPIGIVISAGLKIWTISAGIKKV